MRHELLELLTQLMVVSCGIESQDRFYEAVLPEILRVFGARAVRMVLHENYRHDGKGMFFYRVPGSSELPAQARCVNEVFTHTDREPLFESVPTRLRIPLFYQEQPCMILCLCWDDSGSVPPWASDTEMFSDFSRRLGSFMCWKHIMLHIAKAKHQLEAVFDNLPAPICLIRPDHTVERINQAFADHYSISFQEALSRKCFEISGGFTEPSPTCRLRGCIDSDRDSVEGSCCGDSDAALFPIGTKGKNPKVVKVLELTEPIIEYAKGDGHGANQQFFKLYDELSQPLTALVLGAELIGKNSCKDSHQRYLNLIAKETGRIVSILQRESHRLMGKEKI